MRTTSCDRCLSAINSLVYHLKDEGFSFPGTEGNKICPGRGWELCKQCYEEILAVIELKDSD